MEDWEFAQMPGNRIGARSISEKSWGRPQTPCPGSRLQCSHPHVTPFLLLRPLLGIMDPPLGKTILQSGYYDQMFFKTRFRRDKNNILKTIKSVGKKFFVNNLWLWLKTCQNDCEKKCVKLIVVQMGEHRDMEVIMRIDASSWVRARNGGTKRGQTLSGDGDNEAQTICGEVTKALTCCTEFPHIYKTITRKISSDALFYCQ